jgi:hypothetical protein
MQQYRVLHMQLMMRVSRIRLGYAGTSATECRHFSTRGSRTALYTGKNDTAGAGTHTGHADARTHKGTRTTQTNLTTFQTHEQHTTRTSARRHPTTEAAADRRPNTQQATATGPEPTAPAANSEEAASSEPDPRPCLHPLPEHLPAPARRRSEK